MKEPERNEKNIQRCPKCGRVVGCDVNGKQHRCRCGKRGNWMNLLKSFGLLAIVAALFQFAFYAGLIVLVAWAVGRYIL